MNCDEYLYLDRVVQEYIESISGKDFVRFDLLDYDITIERSNFGSISSRELFSLFEILLLAFYRKSVLGSVVADIGANVGVHSIAMLQAGARRVYAYEPDQGANQGALKRNIERCPSISQRIDIFDVAVSNFDGKSSFVRTVENTTASHLKGKKQPYGKLQFFDVNVIDFGSIAHLFQFAKIDAEGAELDIITSIPVAMFKGFSCFLELGEFVDDQVLREFFLELYSSGVYFYTQDSGWRPVHRVSELPKGWRQGNCFLGTRPPVFL